MPLQNTNAIVTGASMGLGKAIAEAFLKAGANVFLCARTEAPLLETQAELSEKFPDRKVFAQPCDVSDETQVSELFSEAIMAFGNIHSLVLNAGVYGPMGPLETVDLDEWRRAMDINLYGVLLPCRSAVPHFKKNGRGKIVHQQVKSHARGHTEDGGEAEADAVFALQHSLLGLNLAGAIEGDRLEWRFLSAGNARLTDPVSAIGHWHENAL